MNQFSISLNPKILVIAFLCTFLIGGLLLRLGPRLGWLDVPDDPLKAHRRPAVPLGGIALWFGVNLAASLAGVGGLFLALASLFLLVVGLVDDRRRLSPLIRIAADVVAGVVIGFGSGHGWAQATLTTFLVLLAVNAVNLFDGLDGLAGLSALIGALGAGALATSRGYDSSFGVLLAASLTGFLMWNWRPARLFLGDNGAYVLALFLVYSFDRASTDAGELLVASALLGVFLIDMASTFLRRLVSRQPLFSRDRLHLYDRLVDRGLSIPSVSLLSAALELVLVLAVLVADRLLPVQWAATGLLALGGLLVGLLVKGLSATRPGYWTHQ